MPATKQILEEIQSLMNIRTMVQTYEEIAASRMQKIKSSVLSNREFLDSLYGIYKQVTYSYNQKVKELKKLGKQVDTTDLKPRNGKTVAVFLSSNTGLYGDIIRRTFDLFQKSVRGKNIDIVIVGKIGQLMFESAQNGMEDIDYEYFDLPDNVSLSDTFLNLTSYVIAYDRILVYHGQFQTILSQIPREEVMSGDIPEAELKKIGYLQYIYEPSIERVLGFFESEIMAAIFEQSVHESNLSKYASRMISLDEAVVNIGEKIKHAKFTRQRIKHRIANKKQVELMSSMSLWN